MEEERRARLAKAADMVQAFVANLSVLEGELELDPAHGERLSAVQEAARMVADSVVDSPRSLRSRALSDLGSLVLRLADDVEDPVRSTGMYGSHEGLDEIEARRGTVACALLGLATALGGMGSALPPDAAVRSVRAPSRLMRLPRPEVRAWAGAAVRAVSRLERALTTSDEGGPHLRRECWIVVTNVSVALAAAADYGCVDGRIVSTRLADAVNAVTSGVAIAGVRMSEKGTEGFVRPVLDACLGMMPVVEAGMRLLASGADARARDIPAMTWRMLVKGRVQLVDTDVDVAIRRGVLAFRQLGLGGDPDRYETSLVRGSASYREEWPSATSSAPGSVPAFA